MRAGYFFEKKSTTKKSFRSYNSVTYCKKFKKLTTIIEAKEGKKYQQKKSSPNLAKTPNISFAAIISTTFFLICFRLQVYYIGQKI